VYKIIFLLLLCGAESIASNITPSHEEQTKLTPFEKFVLLDKGTEAPFSGEYLYNKKEGIYHCKVCDAPLYHSRDKFDSNCGWPSFDDAIKGAIKETPDADGRRIEITCANCSAHMGHIFRGEGFTPKGVRHCVNSVSLKFKEESKKRSLLKKAHFAGGCFWGVEYYLEQLDGVISVTSGFMGGHRKNPSYYDVLKRDTGHLESVEVTYDPSIISYEALAKHFFEIHDPTQSDGQGPDIGPQYLSAVFVSNATERKTIKKLIALLESKGLKIATTIRPTSTYYPADASHQNYYQRKGGTPYCHRRIKRF
jgi:peptide methionine sulfoxide reductase msrA/msrB